MNSVVQKDKPRTSEADVEESERQGPSSAGFKAQEVLLKIACHPGYSKSLNEDQARTTLSLSEKAGTAYCSQHARVLSLLARAHFRLANHHEALRHSKAAQVHYRIQDFRSLREEVLFEAECLIALSLSHEGLDRLRFIAGQAADSEIGITLEKASSAELDFQVRYGLLLARILRAEGSVQEALLELDRIRPFLSRDDEHLKLKVLEKICCWDVGRRAEQLSQHYRLLIRSKPKDLSSTAKQNEALSLARRQLAEDFISSGQLTRAAELLKSDGPQDSFARSDFYHQALFALFEHDYSWALKLLNSAKEADRQYCAYSERGMLYWFAALSCAVESDVSSALDCLHDFSDLAELSPYTARLSLLEALLRLDLNDGASARLCYERALSAEDLSSNLAQVLQFLYRAELGETQDDSNPDDSLIYPESYFALALLCSAKPSFLLHLSRSSHIEHLSAEFFGLLHKARVLDFFEECEEEESCSEFELIRERLEPKRTRSIIPRIRRGKPFKVQLLGTLRLEAAGHELEINTWRKSKSRELFLAVMVNAGSEISRDFLIEQIWPGMPYSKSMNNYYVTWSNLRKLLSGGDAKIRECLPIKNSGSRFYVDLKRCSIDTIEFEKTCVAAQDAYRRADKVSALRLARQAAELYRGDLLPGDRYYDWIELKREHYRAMFFSISALAARICLELDMPLEAINYCERALLMNPGKEHIVELSMEANLELGRREEAMKAFHECKTYLSEELGLDPGNRLSKLYAKALED